MHLPVSKWVENDSAQDASPTVSAYGGGGAGACQPGGGGCVLCPVQPLCTASKPGDHSNLIKIQVTNVHISTIWKKSGGKLYI